MKPVIQFLPYTIGNMDLVKRQVTSSIQNLNQILEIYLWAMLPSISFLEDLRKVYKNCHIRKPEMGC